MSAFSIKNNKQSVEVKQGEQSSILITMSLENVEDVNYSDTDETTNQKFSLVENISERYKYNPINSYASSFPFHSIVLILSWKRL